MNNSCSSCWKGSLTKVEVGICKKLLGEKAEKYFCIECLASYLDTTVPDLLEKIEEFKDQGCTLFS